MGRVIERPEREHACSPGWTDGGPVKDIPGLEGRRYAIPPTSYDYPKGTVWECECGKVWVSLGAPAPQSPGFCDWRRETWRERRRRERVRQSPGRE